MTTVETMTMMKIRPMKYSLGMSLLLPPPAAASVFPSSSSPVVSAWLELKVRTLSAVREAARGQVRMELKAAPAVLTVRSQGGGGRRGTFQTYKSQREDDDPCGSQEL